MYLPGALRRISRGEVWESALLSPTLRWGLRATAGKREAGSAADSPGRQGRPLGVGKAVSSAQGSHLLLCDLGQETGFSELESLSHRVDMATSLPLSSWLAERNVIVVTSRQPPRWLGELELVPHTFYQLLLKITTSNHTVPSTGTHTGGCSCLTHGLFLDLPPITEKNTTPGINHPELPVLLPFLTIPRGREAGSNTLTFQLPSKSNPTVRPSSLISHLTFVLVSPSPQPWIQLCDLVLVSSYLG